MLFHSTFRNYTLLVSLMILTAACFAQNVPAQSSPSAPPSSASAGSQTGSVPEAETDSADIPPFARGLISEEKYFALRDQEIRSRRGTDDLLRNPQARSQAVRTMQFMERVLQIVPQGLNPFSALIPAAASTTWTPLGPDPIPNGQTKGTAVPVSGRVTAIAVDPTTEQIVYVGTAQGGVYRTLDGGTTWLALLDSAQSLSIGALAIDPLNRDTLFVGTGEGNLSGDSFFGVGLYIVRNASTVNPSVTGPFNAPATSPLPNPDGFTDVFTGRAITQILVNPADDTKILVSTSSGFSGLSSDTFSTLPTRGVYLSTNAQATTPTFTRLAIQTLAANRIVTDIAIDPGNPDLVAVHVFGTAAAGDGGVWISTTSPWTGTGTWQQTLTEQADNGKFAVNRSGAPAATTFLLALDNSVATACGASHGGSLFKSTDGGQTWPELTAARGFCGGQCFYDAVPAMDPDNPNAIFLGGPADSASTPTVEACGNSIVSKSIDGGTSFTRSDNLLHADSHVFVFAPSNHSIAYTGDDGGIFRSADGGATWTSLNNTGFSATQFMSLSVHPTDANFTIGGTQDNGTELMKPDGTWTRADFGDGGYSAIDQVATSTTNVNMYHTYFNVTGGLIGFARVTTSATATEGNWTLLGCSGVNGNGITCADNVLFYAPLALGPGTPNTVYFGTDHLYRSLDTGTTNTPVSQSPFPGTDPAGGNPRVSAIGISPQDDNVRLVGLTTGHVFATTTGANPMTDVTGGWAAKFIARAVIDPNNKTTAYVTLDGYGTPNHVWKTTNLTGEPPTATWTAVSSGLPDVPVNAFAIDPADSNSLYAGTDIGVFNSTDGGATWLPFGTGLPRVAVFDLNIQKSSRMIRIGTHGRGAWEIAAANVSILPDYSINTANGSGTVAAGQPASFTFSITAQGGFAGTISFACSGLPTASNCSFSPATVTASGSTTLTIATTARTVASARPLNGTTLAALTTFGFLGIFFLGGASRRTRVARMICVLLAIAIVVGGVSSCGSPTPKPPPVVTGTPAGSFSVTVNATSGATTHSSIITLVVH